MQKLYEDTDQNEQLVKDMVERYSKIDYDQLSEFDQLISNYILNGELTKADSLLRTKGDINQRVSEYRKHEAVNAKEREELTERQEQLERSEALAIQERDDLANDCYREFEIFKMQHENDSAGYYIELRASLDTTNPGWQLDAGLYIFDYIGLYYKALDYYQKALRQAIEQFGENNSFVAESYDNIGAIYTLQFDYEQALAYYKKALTIQEKNFDDNHPDIAQTHNNLGVVYSSFGEFATALEHHNKSLSIRQAFWGNNHPNTASSYANTGVVYVHLGDFEKALEFLSQASTIFTNSLGENCIELVSCYNNLGAIFMI